MGFVRLGCALLALAALWSCGTPEGQPPGFDFDEHANTGRRIYQENCAACHRLDGQGLPGTYPALDGSPVVRGPRQRHIDIVLLGKPGTVMSAYRDLLDDEQIAAVITYERHAWSNRSRDPVLASEVAAARARLAQR